LNPSSEVAAYEKSLELWPVIARALVLVTVVILAPVGCGDSSSGPGPDIDPSLVGSWVLRASATDESGVFLCTYVAMRLSLDESGRFDWDTVVSPSAAVCQTPAYRRDSGGWHAGDGNIVFAPPPPPLGVNGATLELSYELSGDELHVGPLLFERE